MTLRPLFAFVLLTTIASAQDGLKWHGSYKEALEEAAKTGKPIFLEYRCEP